MKIKPSSRTDGVVVELGAKDDQLLNQAANASASLRIKKILVPTDFSETSRQALRYALAFAAQFGAELTLLHVITPPDAYGEYGVVDLAGLVRSLQEASDGELAKLAAAEVPPTVTARTITRSGTPAQEIIATAGENESDLIIVSTHGRTGLKHVLLGSIAENIVRRAPCPVLVVREREHEFVRA
ncbi:MAG: universal stress protein [Verrucomicrobia bacterium]|nr:universal stress protein [Verrucomicrobiota bacterium]